MPITKPVVYITSEAWNKIRGYVLVSKLECSMLCEVSSEDNKFIIDVVHLPQQTRSAAYTKITHAGIASVLTNKDVNPLKVKCWVHSHVNMGVTPSSVDVQQATELMEDAEWFIRMIVNKSDNYSLFIHWHGIDIECDLEIIDDESFNIEEIEKELEAVTVEPVYTPIVSKQCVSFGTQIGIFTEEDEYEYCGVRRNTQRANKLIYKNHLAQNPHINLATHNNYIMCERAKSYSEWFSAIKKKIPKALSKQLLADAYSEYIDAITVGIYEEWALEESIAEINK